MLETIKSLLSEPVTASFEEVFINYMVSVDLQSTFLEFKYLSKHNSLDLLDIDHLIYSSLEQAVI